MIFHKNSKDFLIGLVKSCEYYDLTEIQSLDLVNSKLSKPISRSTYYNHKKKLYQDEKFQSLRNSVYNSKMLRFLKLYLDGQPEPGGHNMQKLILEKFPNRENVFEVTKE